MQTERVTFLTTPDHKAALDAFAAMNSRSVGHVLREASQSYLAQQLDGSAENADEDDAAMMAILPELEVALARWNRQVDSIETAIDRACAAIDRALESDPR